MPKHRPSEAVSMSPTEKTVAAGGGSEGGAVEHPTRTMANKDARIEFISNLSITPLSYVNLIESQTIALFMGHSVVSKLYLRNFATGEIA